MPARPLADLLLQAMKGPPPPPTPPLDPRDFSSDSTPVDQATTGVVLAANLVIANDNAAQRAEWQRRQETLAAWIVKARAGDPPDNLEDLQRAALEGTLQRGQIAASSLGSPEWHEILDSLEQMYRRTAARMKLSSQKHAAVGRAVHRVETVRGQVRAEMTRINDEAHEEIAAIGDDEARIAAVVLAGRTQVIGVSARACDELCTEIRGLLDLDETTTNTEVAAFLAHNGLSIEQPL